MKKKKTLFEDKVDDVFLKSLSKVKRPLTKNKTLSNFFFICSSSHTKKYYKYFFELNDNYIFCKKNEGENEIAFMDIKNAFMKQTSGTIIDGVPHFGIKFIKKKTYEELFSSDEKLVDRWFEYLKRFCILTKFRSYFKSKKVIGKGNFAKVFLVERIKDKKEYAVKVFNKKVIMADEMEKNCLLYEIKMMRAMDHPRVLKLHELYEGENFIYCLCELYRGADLLKSIIKKGSQPEAKTLTIILQILQGLENMHKNKIIHRDLKPENIIFKSSSQIDIGIVDLGFATYEEDYDKLFKRCGTPGYVAPEILNDKPYNCKVDIYSCGIIFYIM